MAKLIKGEKEIEINDGSLIVNACEDLDIPFSCYLGTCGTCKIKIVKGAENLSELSEEEQIMGMDKDNRLACQCEIKKGDVKIDVD